VPAAGAPPQAAAPDDPFAAPARLEPEQELRTAICQALADGVVTEQERTWLQSERERLGLSSTVASRLFAEEKARATEAAAQPQIGDDGLDDDTAWQATVSSVLGKPEALQSEAYGEYLSRFPEGRHRGGIPAGSLRQLLLKDLLNQRLRRDYLAARTPALLSADLQLASGVPYRVWAVMANLLIIPLWLAYGASWSAADIDFLGWTLGGAGVCTPVWVILAGLRDVRKRSYARFGPLPREAYAKSLVEVRQGFGLGVSHDGGIEVPNDGKEGPR
jgi:hypothetical protein